MIAMLRGKVAWKSEDHLVVDVGGVGYRVFVPTPLIGGSAEGDEIVLHVSTQVREDAIHLFGFESPADRDTFLLLLGVNGVGVRTALSALSALRRAELSRAVADGDVRALERIPGVGKRLAQRLVVELAGRVVVDAVTPSTPTPAAVAANPSDALPLVLARLGFRRTEIDQALVELARDPRERTLEQRVQEALRFLGKGGA